MEFKENLKYFRIENGWQQQDLAAKMEINPKTISSWETGRTEPNLGQLAKLAKVLNCSMDSLAGDETRNVKDITTEEVYAKISTMTNRRELIYIHQLSEQRLDTLRELEQVQNEIANNARKMAELEKRARQYKDILLTPPATPGHEPSYLRRPVQGN